MAKRRKVAYFKRMYLGKNNEVDLVQKMSDIFHKCANNDYDNIKDWHKNDRYIYLSAIQRSKDSVNDDYYIYALNISCIDTDAEIKYGDLAKKVRDRAITPEELNHRVNSNDLGALSNTRIVIDPHRYIIEVCRGMNQLNQDDISHFLKQLIGSRAMDFVIIFDRKAIKDVANMKFINTVEYRVASPSNLKTFADDGSNEDADFRMANALGGGKQFSFSINVKTSQTMGILTKIKKLFNKKSKNKVRKMKVNGLSNNGVENVDLVRNQLKYPGHIDYQNTIETPNYFDFLLFAYNKVYPFIKKMFVAK